jgi:hypothetical protein
MAMCLRISRRTVTVRSDVFLPLDRHRVMNELAVSSNVICWAGRITLDTSVGLMRDKASRSLAAERYVARRL